MHSQALEERLRLVRAQRNKLLSAFENLQGSGGLSHMLLTTLTFADHGCIGNNSVLLCVCGMSGAMHTPKPCSDLDAEIDLHAELWWL